MSVILEFNKDLLWQSYWNGYEVGYDQVGVVGLYMLRDTDIHFYIDMNTCKILEAWDMSAEYF